MTRQNSFVARPENEPLTLCWPTPNRRLFSSPEHFFARTRVNPDYGKPGWTRDCGKRFHHGCDIAPIQVTPTGVTARVIFTDCSTGRDFESDEPAFIPRDEVFSVTDGSVLEACPEAGRSDFGRHVILQHLWPKCGEIFFTLYAHLEQVEVSAGETTKAGRRIGLMGRTSRDPDAQGWMAIAPHLHFETWDAQRRPYQPADFLRAYLNPRD